MPAAVVLNMPRAILTAVVIWRALIHSQPNVYQELSPSQRRALAFIRTVKAHYRQNLAGYYEHGMHAELWDCSGPYPARCYEFSWY